jgi:hypothetical protein
MSSRSSSAAKPTPVSLADEEGVTQVLVEHQEAWRARKEGVE